MKFLSKYSGRDSNIELLRIIAMLGVIILHYNNPEIGAATLYASQSTINLFILHIFESLCICAVNVFIVITGYFLVASQRRNLIKPIELLFEVILFSLGIYVLQAIISGDVQFSVVSFFRHFIPTNWFVVLYIALYIISPYINIILNHLSAKSAGILISILIVLFSVYPTIIDLLEELAGVELTGGSTIGMYGSQLGYTIVNFVLMYCIGAYLRCNNFERVKRWQLLVVLMVLIAVLSVWGFFSTDITSATAYSYCNPIVVFEAAIVFLLFKRISIHSAVINFVSKASFTVFLLHNYMFRFAYIEKFVTGNVGLMILHIIGSAIIIYLLCFIIDIIYHFCVDWLFNLISKKITKLKYCVKEDETSSDMISE